MILPVWSGIIYKGFADNIVGERATFQRCESCGWTSWSCASEYSLVWAQPHFGCWNRFLWGVRLPRRSDDKVAVLTMFVCICYMFCIYISELNRVSRLRPPGSCTWSVISTFPACKLELFWTCTSAYWTCSGACDFPLAIEKSRHWGRVVSQGFARRKCWGSAFCLTSDLCFSTW